jgi:hypothetical protein
MFYPKNSITNWGPTLVKLAMALSAAAYDDNFNAFNGTLLYAHRNCSFEQPVFYVYSLDSALWIITRGSANVFDFLTCAEFNETTTDYGVFHLGAFEASLFIFQHVRDFVEAWNGPIYFTGHSYGGTTSPVLAVIFSKEYPAKDVNSIGFATLPPMDDATSTLHKDKIATIVNEVDIVPTLSVPNIYVTLAALIPFFAEIDEDALIAELESILDLFWFVLPTDLFDALREVIPAVADAVLAYSHGEERKVRYPPGHCYQLFKGQPKKLADDEVDPTKAFGAFSISIAAVEDHMHQQYQIVVDEIPNDQRYLS